MSKVGLSLVSSFEKLFNKAPDPSKSTSSIVYVFPDCIPILLINSITNPILVFFSIIPSLKAHFSIFTLPLKKSVYSYQVCGKCIPVRVSLYLHHTDNRHNLYTLRFIVPFVRLSGSPPPPPPYPLCRAHPNRSLHHQHPTRPPADLHPRPRLHHSSGLLYLLARWVWPPSHHHLVPLPHLTFIPCKLALKMSSSNPTRNMASPPSFLLSLGTSLLGM